MQNLILLQCQITCIYFPHNSLARSINSSTGLFPLARLSWVWAGPSPDFPSYVERGESDSALAASVLASCRSAPASCPLSLHWLQMSSLSHLMKWIALRNIFWNLSLLSSHHSLTDPVSIAALNLVYRGFADRNTSWKWNELCFVYDRRGLSDILLLGMFLTCQSRTSLSLKWLI